MVVVPTISSPLLLEMATPLLALAVVLLQVVVERVVAVVPTPAGAPTPLPVRVKAPVAPAMAMAQVKVLGRA